MTGDNIIHLTRPGAQVKPQGRTYCERWGYEVALFDDEPRHGVIITHNGVVTAEYPASDHGSALELERTMADTLNGILDHLEAITSGRLGLIQS